jgi:hypothetical protein
MYVTCKKSKANLKLTNKLIVSPETSTINGELLIDWTAELGSFWNEELVIVCMLPGAE